MARTIRPRATDSTIRVADDGADDLAADAAALRGRRVATSRRRDDDDDRPARAVVIVPRTVVVGPEGLTLDGKDYEPGRRLTLPPDEAQGFVDAGHVTFTD
jgi:hypothetical protein